MNCMILVEGETDAAILRRLLAPPRVGDTAEIVVGGGSSSVVSLARSYLITRPEPVAVVVDADTTDLRRAGERRSDIVALLHMVAPSSRSEVFMAIPSIEMIFFHDKQLAEKVFGSAYDGEQRVRSEYEPKAVLERVFLKPGERLINRTDDLIAAFGAGALRKVPLIANLISFTQRAPVTAAVA